MKRWFPLYNEKFRLRSIISMRIILKNSDSFYDYCRPRRNRKALRMKRKPACFLRSKFRISLRSCMPLRGVKKRYHALCAIGRRRISEQYSGYEAKEEELQGRGISLVRLRYGSADVYSATSRRCAINVMTYINAHYDIQYGTSAHKKQ